MPRRRHEGPEPFDLTERLNLRISSALLKRIQHEAIEREISYSRLVIQVLEENLPVERSKRKSRRKIPV